MAHFPLPGTQYIGPQGEWIGYDLEHLDDEPYDCSCRARYARDIAHLLAVHPECDTERDLVRDGVLRYCIQFDEINTATHEAGHAVAAIKLGRAVRFVTVVPSPGLRGMCVLMRPFHWPDREPDARLLRRVEIEVMFGLAGGCAASWIRGNRREQEEDMRSDMEAIRSMLMRLHDGDRLLAEDHLRLLRARTRRMVQDPNFERAVKRVAVALCAAKTIYRERLHEIVKEEMEPMTCSPDDKEHTKIVNERADRLRDEFNERERVRNAARRKPDPPRVRVSWGSTTRDDEDPRTQYPDGADYFPPEQKKITDDADQPGRPASPPQSSRTRRRPATSTESPESGKEVRGR